MPKPYLALVRRPAVLLLHVLLIPSGFYGAFLLRFDFAPPPEYVGLFWMTVPYVLVLRLACFAFFRLFQGWWRHVGMRDLVDLVRATTLSSLLLLPAIFMLGDLNGLTGPVRFPRSVLVLDWILALVLFGGFRFLVRAFREERLSPWRQARGRSALLIGAGNAAERLLRETQRADVSGIDPVGLVDDDAAKHGMRLHGIPVLGSLDDLPTLVGRYRAELLVIAIPSASRPEMRRIVDACLRTGKDFKIVPSMREMLDGRARVGELRKVQIEDLLGRETIELEMDGPSRDISGRTVLVTGGAGSIGSELARQAARFGPRRLILLDQAESALYFMQLELRTAHPQLEITPLVADITDHARMESIFARFRPDFVFHAAAYKHVPLMEEQPVEAIRNNVLGTLCVAETAARYGVAKFVMISTDKAVNPSSVMGASKRIAEHIVLGWPALTAAVTDFRAVRFGNVLGSDGSVIPLFKRQLAAGQPLTVTHPEVTRYFMTIPEAVQLVLQAAALPEARGRIAMLDMGEPVRIVDLAENLIRLSGLEPHVDVPILFTGLRPGEKLHEELMSEVEVTCPTSIERVRIVQSTPCEPVRLTEALDGLAAAAEVGNDSDILAAIRVLLPECVSPLRDRSSIFVDGD
jgi:FlaA1/EpsC-like NDP-sugar epimerase